MRELILRSVSWLILTICLIVTIIEWKNAENRLIQAKQARFDSLVRQTTVAIIDRIATYTDAHYGGVGLFASSEHVSRHQWKKYIETLNIMKHYPGINGLGYAIPVPYNELKHFELETQKDNAPNYIVTPPGERADYFAIKYIEPIEINRPALGYDMGSEQTRRKAMEKARDTGKPTISGKIILVQDMAQTPGFLLYVPFYKEGSHPNTVKARRQNFQGWIYAPFIASDFIKGIFKQSLHEIKNQITLEIYNDKTFSKDKIIYESPTLYLVADNDTWKTEFQTTTTINLHRQEWTLRIKTTPQFYDAFTGHHQHTLILTGGILLSLLMFAFVNFIVRTRDYAIQLVNEMRIELHEANERLRRLDKLKDDFVSNSPHELRTPLLSLKQGMGLLADYNRTLEQKVKERTHELSQALEHLKDTQQELVQSEKMAALGQLVAGIAHEINTPLAAIHSSVSYIAKFMDQTLAQLPTFFDLLSTEQKQNFLALLQRSLQQKTIFSVKEERQIKKILTHQLEQHNIKNATIIATKLVRMGIYDKIETLLPLLKDANSAYIIQTTYKLSGLQKSTQNISIAVKRVSKIVFALKNYAHYDHSGEKVLANLIDGIETVLTLYHNQLKQEVEIIRNYIELPPIMCYLDELNQVWTNLIHNALQAMNNKGTLQIDTTLQNSFVVISITDSGKGIPDNIKPKIFDAFFTTKPQGEGNGLGLDIARKIIEKHKGKITVNSKPGKTTFNVFLPS